ncbi:MAG: ISH3 family transposase [Anaerolineae bacterium]|nr:ISH3 family transposase [Anaerolineae bacterium]NIN98759.1 ISH3 family transposase [Anaerolineae bacterium]NIQ81654.1 ISH3 family transposase [Anaerolineae bacterium]
MSRSNDTIVPSELTASDALGEIIAVVKGHFPLQTAGRKWIDADIYRVLIKASAEASTVEHICEQMEKGPDANTVFYWLKPIESQPLRQLEGVANEALIARLPPRLDYRPRQAAIDFVFIPYHGEPAREEEEIRRGRAKHGTTHFHCYATVYIIYQHKRVTVALTGVRADDDALTVLQRLLARLKDIGLRCSRLYLDRQFYCVSIIRFLQTQPFVSIMPVVRRGERMKALLRVNKSYRTSYTMRSQQQGEVTFQVWVVCRYLKGRRGQHGIERLGYVVIGDLPWHPTQVRDGYRRRFGVETSYRLMNQVRARTTSPEPNRRLLYVALAFLLANLWTYLKWRYLRRGRRVYHKLLPLATLATFLSRAVEAVHGVKLSVVLQSQTPALPIGIY